MATTNDSNSLPYPPSPIEAKFYYYGIPTKPFLVARSSANVWTEPTGPEAYLLPKESSPVGSHPLQAIWEATVGPAMVAYLDSKGVKWTSLDPIRMGQAGKLSLPVIIWLAVVPGSLSAQNGVEIATDCKAILTAHAIDDVHVEIRESEVFRSAKMYEPAFTFKDIVQSRKPFSTALGLSICAEDTPSIEGTGGLFISDPRYPGKIYLVTARHVVFPPDEDSNELYQHSNPGQRRKNVLLFGDAAIEKYITAIKSEIRGQYIMIDWFERRLEGAEQMDEEHAEAEREHVRPQLEQAKEAIGDLETFLADVSRDWKARENRVLGHVVLSPPIGYNVGEEGFTEDWAVIEVDASKVDSTNFVGNVVDLGTKVSVGWFTRWMCPHPANPRSFEYPWDHLLEFHGTISDEEMWKPNPGTFDHDSDPYIMVVKRSNTSGLTVGRLNTIRSFTRVYPKDQPGRMSKEVAILPHRSESEDFPQSNRHSQYAFSEAGDSGSAVVDGKGRLAGLLTGGAGVPAKFDCTYLTSINFIVKRMLDYGLRANLSPSLNA